MWPELLLHGEGHAPPNLTYLTVDATIEWGVNFLSSFSCTLALYPMVTMTYVRVCARTAALLCVTEHRDPPFRFPMLHIGSFSTMGGGTVFYRVTHTRTCIPYAKIVRATRRELFHWLGISHKTNSITKQWNSKYVGQGMSGTSV